jgi:hypothetical protein
MGRAEKIIKGRKAIIQHASFRESKDDIFVNSEPGRPSQISWSLSSFLVKQFLIERFCEEPQALSKQERTVGEA